MLKRNYFSRKGSQVQATGEDGQGNLARQQEKDKKGAKLELWEEKTKKRQKKRIPNKRIGPRTRRAVESGVLANAKTLDRESIVALLFYFVASSKTRNNNRTISALHAGN